MSISLTPIELERLKLLLSERLPQKYPTSPRRTLSMDEKILTLRVLRSKFPDLFSGLTEENLKDNDFLIKFLTNSQNINRIRNTVLNELSSSQQIELVEILEEKPVTEEGVGGEVSGQGVSAEQAPPADTATGASAGGMPGMPSFPSISPARRRIYRASRTEPPKPEIHIANASGYVTEPGDASKLVRATPTGVVKEAGEPSKLVTTSGGAVTEPPPSKIFIANSSGAVTGERPIMPASAAKLSSRKKEKKRWFGRLRPSGSFNFLDLLSKRFASWIWRNALRPVLNFAWRSLLQPALRWLAGQAGRLLFQLLPRLALGALNALAGMLGGIGGLSGIAFAAGSALFWGGVAAVSFVVVTILATFLSPFITPIKEPVQVNYTLPLREPKAVPSDIKAEILQNWPQIPINSWQTIIDAAVANNWNPSLLLTLWIEASGNQGKVDYIAPSLVCDPDPARPESALEINLRCFFKKYANYNDNEFPRFIEDYAKSNTPRGESYESYYNEDFLQRIKYWYTQMVPDGEWAIKEIAPGETQASCPIPGGVIKTPSYQANPTTGHCSPAYGSCPAESRRAKSIDVDTRGENVLFPTIDGQEVNWYFINRFPLDSKDCEGGKSDCGIMTVFQAPVGPTKWILHLLHLDPNPNIISFDTSGPNRSRSIAGKTVSGVYVHINIGKGILNAQYPPQGDLDLDPGWLIPDFMCQ